MPLPPAFHRLAWSNLFAQFSEQMALAAAPLAAVLLLSAGPAETGWLQAAQTLPFLLFSIPAGLAADRVSRRSLMAGAEALRALTLAATVALLAGGALSLPWLAALGFFGAIGTVCYSVAAPALVPTIVPREGLAAANRWLELARSAAFMAGPAIGGAVVAWMGAFSAFSVATGLSLAATLLLSGLPAGAPPVAARRDLLAELKEGARFVAGHELLRPILVTAVFFNLAWFVLQAVFVAYAVERLGAGPAQIGFAMGLYGAGMVAGALLAPLVTQRLRAGAVILVGPIFGFLGASVMLATVLAPGMALAGLSFFLFGAGPILWTIATTTLRQIVTPNAMLGRVSAIVMTATFGARPIGAALGALTAGAWGAPACLALAFAGFAIQLAVIAASKAARLEAWPQASG